MTLRHQIFSALRWSAGVRLASQLFTWTITLIVVRLLSPKDYGLLSMAMVFVGLLSMIAEFGLGPAIVQKVKVSEAELRKVFGLVIVIHVSLCSCLLLAAPFIAAFFSEPRLTLLISVLAFGFLVAAFQVVPDALLQRQMEFRRRSLNDFVATIVGSVTTLTCALLDLGVWSLVAGSLTTQTWKAVGLNRIMPYLRWPDLRPTGLRQLLLFGGHLSVANILWFIFLQTDVILGGKFLGKDLLGLYTVAVHLASLPNQRMSSVINQIAFPAFARMQEDVRRVGAGVLKGVRILSFISFPLLWGLASVAPEFVSVVLGEKWRPAFPTLAIVALMMPMRMISSFVSNAVQGMGRSDIVLRTVVFANLVVPVCYLIGLQWGLIGLSLAWLAWAPLVFLYSVSQSVVPLRLRTTSLFSAMLRPAAASGIMVVAVCLARFLLETEITQGWMLGVMILTGALTYIGSSLLLNRNGILELKALAKDLIVSPRKLEKE